MSDTKRYTVLGFGEKYIAEAQKRGRPPGDPPVGRPLSEARTMLTPLVDTVLRTASKLQPKQRIDEVVVELRLDEKFLAKSYNPTELLNATGLKLRGTGTWTQNARPRGRKLETPKPVEPMKSRALFVSGPITSLRRLADAVKRGLSPEVDSDIVKLEDVRLPSASDRLSLALDDAIGERAVEIVLFNWDGQLRRQAVEHVLDLFRRFNVSESKYRVKEYTNGPTFIAGVVPAHAFSELGEYNFLRAARPLPRVSLTKAVMRHAVPFGPSSTVSVLPASEIAVFDGGYGGHPLLDSYVKSNDLTPAPPDPDAVEHGTMVISAAVYGPFDLTGAVPAPQSRVSSFRVLPDPMNDHLELYGAIDAIEQQVPRLGAGIQVINLSFGPSAPIDDVPSRFTYALDRLAREHSKLFVTAVGNDGERHGADRVQAPSDSVNNLGIGAYRHDSSGAPEHARYSCKGFGRSGGTLKPDLVAFGGCDARPFFALVPGTNALGDPSGTSFAAPLVSALAGRLGALVDKPVQLQPEAIRALLVHAAVEIPGNSARLIGHGRIPRTVEEVLACSEKRVSVLYQGVVSPRQSWKLPFLLPQGFAPGGKVRFEWTVAYAPEIDPSSPDEYALAGLELAFRPHADVYSFSPPTGSTAKARVLNVVSDAAEVRALIARGWKQSILPKSDSKKGQSEATLRASEGKWETLIRDERGKLPNSISEPLLTIAVHGRGVWDQKDPSLRARFAAVLTVDAPKYDGDLYAEVLATWNNLQPLRLRGQARPAQQRLRL